MYLFIFILFLCDLHLFIFVSVLVCVCMWYVHVSFYDPFLNYPSIISIYTYSALCMLFYFVGQSH